MTSPTAPAPAQAHDVVPPPLALSTMWAVQPRFEHDLLAFMERASALGFSAIELNHSMDAQQVGAALASRALPVASVHAPAPLERLPGGRENRALDLSSLDEQERLLAVRHTLRSIEVAAEGGARHVVVHLGGTAPGGRGVLTGERRLRELYTRRDLLADECRSAVACGARTDRAGTRCRAGDRMPAALPSATAAPRGGDPAGALPNLGGGLLARCGARGGAASPRASGPHRMVRSTGRASDRRAPARCTRARRPSGAGQRRDGLCLAGRAAALERRTHARGGPARA